MAGLGLVIGGSLVGYGAGMLASYANYKAQKAFLAQQYVIAKSNYKTMTDNANEALSALSYNEGVMGREHNRRLASIESSFAASGVSADSVSAQKVYDAQREANLEELWAVRWQAEGDIGNLILDRNNMMAQAESDYAWGRSANKLTTIFSMVGQTSKLVGDIASMPAGKGKGLSGGGFSGSGKGLYGSGATDLARMDMASVLA